MHKRLFVSLLVVIVLSLMVIACAPAAPIAPSTGTQPTTAPAAQPTAASATQPSASTAPQVTIWIIEGPEGNAMVKAAEEYNKKFNANVVVQLQGRNAIQEKQRTAMASGAAQPDMHFIISPDLPSLAAAGFLDPWDPYVKDHPELNWETDFFPTARSESMFDGKIYMLPTDVTGEVLIYNSELIPNPPKDWNEYLETAKKFTKSINPDSPTDYGTAFGGRPSIASESWSIHLWSQGGDILDENGKVVVDSPVAIESFKWWVDMMRNQKVVPPDVTSWAYPEKNVALQEIRIPMASHFQAGLPVLNDCAQSPKVCGKMKLSKNPAGPAGSITFVQTLGLLLNSKSKNKDAAADFAFWVVSPEGAKIFTLAGGTSPRISVFGDPAVAASRGAWWKDYEEALQSGHGTIRDPHASELLEALDAQISKAYAGQIPPEEALKQAAADMRKILGQ